MHSTMWKKMQAGRSREPKISNPTLVDTTLDESFLLSMSDIPSRKDRNVYRKDDFKALPSLPLQSRDTPRVVSMASSTYSRDITEPVPTAQGPHHPLQSSPVLIEEVEEDEEVKADASDLNTPVPQTSVPDVSPPDSPIEDGKACGHSSPDISPISDVPALSFPTVRKHRLDSHLPVRRKEVTPGKGVGVSILDPGHLNQRQSLTPSGQRPRWGSPTGESTTGDLGEEEIVKTPGDHLFRQHADHKQPLDQGKRRASNMTQFQAKTNISANQGQDTKANKQNQNNLPREPWKGASGRFPIINPIKSKQGSRSHSIPDQARKNGTTTFRVSPGGLRSPTHRSFSTTTTVREPNEAQGLFDSRGRPRRVGSAESPERTRHPNLYVRKALNPGNPPANNPAGEKDKDSHLEPVGDPVGHVVSETEFTSRLKGAKILDHPASRFSATTCATNDVADISDILEVDENDIPSVSTVSSVMVTGEHRVPSATAPTKSKMKKPIPLSAPVSSVQTLKALPRSPPEIQAESRVDALKARQDDLARREANINTIIYELTQVIQPSSIAYDIATRDEVKKTVASLNNELADIKKEEHEVGVKLLRAWKKRDDEEVSGGLSSLWVRRVTH